MMSLSAPARLGAFSLLSALALLLNSTATAQTAYYATNGTESAFIGLLPGDQVFPDAAISPSGGFMVWQDNITDGDGWGVSARRLDATLSGTLSTFRVNVTGVGNQEKPRVALIKNGGAVFVWQGGLPSQQHIYARFLTASNTFLSTNDILINSFTNNFQISPAVAVLTNGNVVVVWSSFDEVSSSSMQDVYARIFSVRGQPLTGELLVNEFTNFNQRTPAVAALNNGGFIVAWVSEQQRTAAPNLGTNLSTGYTLNSAVTPSIDIYARTFDASGAALGHEFIVNTDFNPAAHPSVAAGTDGGFLVAWDARDLTSVNSNSLDIYARPFSGSGTGGSVLRLNSYLYGDQYAPRVQSIGTDYFVVWTSLGQDGSREGVYGQFLRGDGSTVRGELRVNTTTVSQQLQPVVASDGAEQFLVVWSSYTGSPYNFDLFDQRFLNVSAVLQPMSAPYVWVPFVLSNNIYQPQLVISWAPLLGLSVSNFEVYVDGSSTLAALTTSNQWTMTSTFGLTTNSYHSFQVDYVTTDGRRSPISPAAGGTTWSGLNWGGIPDEWMAAYFGGYIGGKYYSNNWPTANVPLAGGMPLLNIFTSGGNPLDSSTWLKQSLVQTAQGLFLNWNTQPGATYQVLVSPSLLAPVWSNYGSPRFAAGTTDSINVGGGATGYYRVVLLR